MVNCYLQLATAVESKPFRSTCRSQDIKLLRYLLKQINGSTFRKAVCAFWSAIFLLH